MTEFLKNANDLPYLVKMPLGLLMVWVVLPFIFCALLLVVFPAMMVIGTISSLLGRLRFEENPDGTTTLKF